MRRIVLGALAGFAVAVAVSLAMLLAPLETHDGVRCGSVLRRVEPDPTSAREYGCSDLATDQRGLTLLVAALAGPLLTGVGAATAASTLLLGRRAAPEPFAP